MHENKYYITVNNEKVAENVPAEYVSMFCMAISETLYAEPDLTIAFSKMPEGRQRAG